MNDEQPDPHGPWVAPADLPAPAAVGAPVPPTGPAAPAPSPFGAPPAPSPYGAAPMPGHGYAPPMALRDNSDLGTVLLVLGGVWTLFQVIGSVLATEVRTRQPEVTADAGNLLLVYGLVGLLSLATMLGVWIVGSLWLSTAYDNARAIAPQNLTHKKLWVWLGWWVPIVSLWFPKVIVDDVWFTTASRTRPVAPQRSTGAWWGFWVAAVVLSGFLNLQSRGDTVSSATVTLGWVVTICLVVAFVFWVRVVRGLSATQSELARRPSGMV